MGRLYHSLPEQLDVKGTAFFYHKPATEPHLDGTLRAELAALKAQGLRYRMVHVLSRNLRGRTDLHGRPYQPHAYIYTNKNRYEKV